MSTIVLCCAGCGRAMDYDRSIDPSIPASVVKITQGGCDVCWNGDFDDEIWFDAKGREISQEPVRNEQLSSGSKE
jgi:hypothetical protein